ncbi:MAG: mRNA interferase [Parcubacteria group bacterium Gr01-1014_29]|nr:MAG: mRNA interferase [Parcubacteria group bacterium Gr01-1014_29]
MVAPKYVPERGDIVWAYFEPHRGHEEAGRRPALVLTSKIYNHRANLMLICPITSRLKGYPFEVSVEGESTKGVVLVDQVRAMDWNVRNVSFITKINSAKLLEVTQKLIALITT